MNVISNNLCFLFLMSNDSQNFSNKSQLKQNFSQQIKTLMQNNLKNGKYQSKMIVIFILISLTTSFQYNCNKVLYMNPVFNCNGLQGKITEEQACKHIDICTIIDSETVTAELQLYCGPMTDYRIAIQTTLGIGNLLGLLFMAIISDRKGRKFSIIFSLTIFLFGCIISFMAINMQIIILLVISQAFIGFAGKAVYFNFLILCTRFLEKNTYEGVSVCWMIMYNSYLRSSGFSDMSVSMLNEYFESWRSLFYIYFIGCTISVISATFVLYQDPIYFFDIAQYQKCKQIIRKVDMQNCEEEQQTQAKVNQINRFIQIKNQYRSLNIHINTFNYKALMTCDIIVNIAVLATVGCLLTMAFESMNLSIQGLKQSFNINLFIIGGAKIIGNFLGLYLLRIENNRKRGLIFTAFICGLASSMFIIPFCTQNGLIQSTIIVILRIGLCLNNSFFVRLSLDLFPQKYQATLVGCVQMINLGRILAPIFTQLSIENHLNPLVSINMLKVTLGTLPIFFLKEHKLAVKQAKQNEISHLPQKAAN